MQAISSGEGVFDVGLGQQTQQHWESGVVFAHSLTQNKSPCHALSTHLALISTSILSSTMCTQPSNPFAEPFYSLKKAFTRLLSPLPEPANGIIIARPSSGPSILITPSSTICAADIDMPVTSKIPFHLPAPRSTLIIHQIEFPGDQVEVAEEGVVEHSQQVIPISTGLY